MVCPLARAGATIVFHAGSALNESVAPQPGQMWVAAVLTTFLNWSESAQYPLLTCASNQALAVEAYAGRPVISLTDCGPLVAYCRKAPTHLRSVEWLEPYQKPPPTLPVAMGSPAQCSGMPAPHSPAGALRPVGLWMTAPLNQVGPGMARSLPASCFGKSGVKRPTVDRLWLASMWSMRAIIFVVWESVKLAVNVLPLSV